MRTDLRVGSRIPTSVYFTHGSFKNHPPMKVLECCVCGDVELLVEADVHAHHSAWEQRSDTNDRDESLPS